jgi:lycopene cyclase domain-containing protein
MLVLILFGIVPLALSFWPPFKFYRYPRAFWQTIVCVLLIFGTWDVFAVYRGHWLFDPGGVWPWRVINLPVEEVLFFIVIPFCCIFTWEVLKFLSKKS